MANVLSLAIQNGAIARYGSLQRNIRPLPRAATTAFAGGANDRLLDSVPPVPDDDRAAEVTQAFAFGAVVAACVGINAVGGLFGLQDLTFWTNLILGVAITTVVVDNFFDALVLGGSTVAKLNADKLPEGAKKLNAPTKEDMPLGIGTGRLTGTVVRGMSRLLSDNTERDCQCEAAAVFAAYGLGLPCFAFQPNALEVRAVVVPAPARRPPRFVVSLRSSLSRSRRRHGRGPRWSSSPRKAVWKTDTGPAGKARWIAWPRTPVF